MALEVEIESNGDKSLLRVTGEIDLNSSPSLRKTILKAVEKARNEFAVDLSEVPYMDSSGVATLVEALKLCDKKEINFIISEPSHSVLKVLQLSRLDQVFTIRTKITD